MSEIEDLSKGKTTCDRNTLVSIINLATKEISGVARLSSAKERVINRKPKENKHPGIKFKIDEYGKLFVEIYIDIINGFSVPDVAFKIQESVKNNITAMMDIKIAKINVHVMDVCEKIITEER